MQIRKKRQDTVDVPNRSAYEFAPRNDAPVGRYRMIQEAAYFRAEKRGFTGGSAESDWLEAEAEIDNREARSHV